MTDQSVSEVISQGIDQRMIKNQAVNALASVCRRVDSAVQSLTAHRIFCCLSHFQNQAERPGF